MLQCVFQGGRGFRAGGYQCRCVEGFFDPEGPDNWTGLLASSETPLGPRSCVRCPDECQPCKGGRCEAQLQPTLRAALLATQAVCMALTFVGAVALFRNRKRKVSTSKCFLIKDQSVCFFIKLLGRFLCFPLKVFPQLMTIHDCFQPISSSMWTMLETILLGTFMLYAAVSK